MLFTTTGTFTASSHTTDPQTGEIISIGGKRGSGLTFTALHNDTILQGDSYAANKNDAIIYDLTLNGVNALRLSGFAEFSLGSGDDLLDLGVRTANAARPYSIDITGRGGVGSDMIWSGRGDDTLFGESETFGVLGDAQNYTAGSDRLNGGIGDDVLYGDAERLLGAVAGNDALAGGDGNDLLYGDSDTADRRSSDVASFGDDTLLGGGGNDTLYGDGDALAEGIVFGDDVLDGGDGDDFLYGDYFSLTYDGGGDDRLNGGAGSDLLRGGMGNDILNGGSENDYLYGGAGKDILNGGTQVDRLFGGTEDDTFIAQAKMGRDIITDFEDVAGASDKIDVSALGIRSFAALSVSGNGTAIANIAFTATDSFEVRHAPGTPFTLDATDFIFAP